MNKNNTTQPIPNDLDQNLKLFFARADLHGKTIVVYSAGKLTQAVLTSKKYPNHRISKIFDKNKALHGKTIEHISIHSPSEIRELNNAVVIIISTVGFPGIYLELKPLCDELGIELLDISLEYKVISDGAEFDFSALQANYREQGLVNAFSQTRSRNYLWHVAMPKSGSTWLTAIMENIYHGKGWESGRLFPGRRNYEIDPRYFFMEGGVKSNVFFHHQHCEYTDYTAYLILRSLTKCIVQTRSLLDVVVSLADWYRHVLINNIQEPIYLPNNAACWSDEYLLDYIIDHDVTWHIRFIDGWVNSDLMRRGDLLTIVRYENLVANPLDEVARILKWANLEVSRDEIRKILDSLGNTDTKKNKAIVGRGRQLLTKHQVTKIENLASYFFNNPDEIL